MAKLDGKVVVVTGSSSGIGRAIALQCAKERCKVICSDIQKSARENGFEKDIEIDTDQLIIDAGGDAVFVLCDVTKSDEVEALIQTAVDKYGRLDIIFNCAGIFVVREGIADKSDEVYDLTVNVNLKGVWNGCKYAIRQFLKQGTGGKIVNISSIGGIVALSGEPEYCASKGAVSALTQQLALDYGPMGINVNAVCPGNVRTAMSAKMPEDAVAFRQAATPLRRMSTPDDVAKPSVFLATSDADYITGHLLVVDGGITLGF